MCVSNMDGGTLCGKNLNGTQWPCLVGFNLFPMLIRVLLWVPHLEVQLGFQVLAMRATEAFQALQHFRCSSFHVILLCGKSALLLKEMHCRVSETLSDEVALFEGVPSPSKRRS